MIHQLFDGSDWRLGYYCKGHIDKEEFVSEVEWGYEERINPTEVEYQVVRCVPNPEGGFFLHDANLGTRGAFPVTIWLKTHSQNY